MKRVRAFQVLHRALRAADRRTGRRLTAVRAVHTGAWLGALSNDALAALDEATYAASYAYHTTEAHNLAGLFPWEEDVLARHFPRSGRLLVTSAGAGREVVALRRKGFDVDAFECNAQLCDLANALLARLELHGDVRLAPRDGWVDVGATYDGIVVGWGSYTNIRGRARRVALLRGLRGMTNPGAPLVASFFPRPSRDRAFRVTAMVGNGVAGLLGHEAVEVGDVIDPTYQHYFAREEAFAELRAGGFRPVEWSEEGYGHAVGVAE
ncbi:MAG: hypothetical protein H6737_29600 [Alphaproteobacteria bacterium]|nr:hypothetical protein [Alphaproteobacteria bacterium]